MKKHHAIWAALIGLSAIGAAGCDGGGGGGGGGGGTVVTPSAPPAEQLAPAAPSAPSASAPPASAGGGGGGGASVPSTPSAPSTPSVPTNPGDYDLAAPAIGMNLSALTYYTPEWPFVDVFKASNTGSTYAWDLLNPNGLATPALDAQGYPRGLGNGQVASALCLRSIGGHYPAGAYTVLFEGDGEVAVGMDATGSLDHDGSGTGRFVATVTKPSGNGIHVRILRSSPTNHVRNIRVIMPGFEGSYASSPFHPLYLQRLAPFPVLRFMDWNETNNSNIVSWSARKLPGYRTQFRGGVAYEWQIDLANAANKHPWICVPHKADDDYVRNLATLIKGRLKAGLKVHIEYSNEVWNGGFQQYSWVAAQASAAGTTWYVQYARRAVQIFKIFESVFGGKERLVRVLASQSGNPWVGKQILDATPAGAADAFAIAPYIGSGLGKASTASTVAAYSVTQVLDLVRADIATVRAHVKQNREYAAAKGLPLIAYEGGQHLAGVGAAVDNTTLVNLFTAANRDPRMNQLHKDYLKMWKEEGGGLFVAFNFIYVPQKWGNWGALEWMDQQEAPKYQAYVDVAADWKK